MAVALTRLAVEGMDLSALAERLVIVKRQAVVTLEEEAESFELPTHPPIPVHYGKANNQQV